MDIDIRTVLMAVGLFAAAITFTACTSIGNGSSTLVLAEKPTSSTYSGNDFSQLVSDKTVTLVGQQGKAPLSKEQWDSFRIARHSPAGSSPATISVSTRDQTTTPALDLFNIETTSASDVAKILADRTLSNDDKDRLLIRLRDNYRAMPETYSRLVSKGAETAGPNQGGTIYSYFPQVTVDLSAALTTAEPLDRFEFFGLAIRLVGNTNASFINFSPKAADLFDFTLGQLKQTASLNASLTAGNKGTGGNSSTDKSVTGLESGRTSGSEATLGGSLTFAQSDEFTRDLKASLEARSAGIFEDGKVFIVELRANTQKRISGTYTYNLMLEVPAMLQKTKLGRKTVWESIPKTKALVAEARVVGVVREVKKVGLSGFLKRVPEPSNDVVFQEVVLKDSEVLLWRFNEIPLAVISEDPNLTIYTNHEDASYTVFDESSGPALAHASGKVSRLSVDTNNKVRVDFHPIIIGGAQLAEAQPSTAKGVDLTKSAVVVGTYVLKKTEEKPHGN